MKQYIVDAFTDEVFKGNQAAVCVMDEWLPDEVMKKIAAENNFSETAFIVKEDEGYRLRWFTPGDEVNLCGHATLASSYVLFRFYGAEEPIVFHTLSGDLFIRRDGDRIIMDFPAYKLNRIEVTDAMEEAFHVRPKEAYLDRDLLCIFEDEKDVRDMKPDLDKLMGLPGMCAAVSAKGSEYDCVSRVFCPKVAVNEDPVTGSSHCMIVPYWSDKLNKKKLTAFQASARTGILYCEDRGERIIISGKAALFACAQLYL